MNPNAPLASPFRRSLTVLAAAALLAPLAVAQGASLTTATAVGAFAKDGTGDLDTIAARTPITAPVAVQAGAGGGMASTAIAPMRTNPLAVVVAEDAVAANANARGSVVAGTTDATDPRNVQPAPHSILMQLLPARNEPLRGALVVRLGGQADGGARASAAVDIGDDGRSEFTETIGARPVEQKFRINTSAPVSVRITTAGLAQVDGQGRSSYSFVLQVEFVGSETGCAFDSYGKSCGPRLSGQDDLGGRLHSFTFQQSGAFPSSPGALLLGVRPAQVAIPGTRCELLVAPVVAVPFSSDASGNAILQFGVPGPVSGDIRAQGVSFTLLPAFRLETSNGLHVGCR